MNFNDEDFSLDVNGCNFLFKGKIEKSSYTDLSAFLKECDAVNSDSQLVFDFRLLEYLNSSGIRAIAVFFLECNKSIKLVINNDITWQKVGLTPLCAMKPDGSISIEG